MDLSYFNARVRAWTGRLLRKPDYAPFFGLEGGARYVERLRSTVYGPYLEVAGARYERTEDIVSAALTDSLADSFARIGKNAPGAALTLLGALNSTIEAYNLKTVIRGIARGVGREEVRRALIPAGGLGRAPLNTLLGAKDVPDLLRFLETWASPWAAPVRQGMAEFLRKGSLATMEIKLDQFAYGAPLARLGRSRAARTIRDVLVFRIDIRNVVTLINIAGQGYSQEGASELFIDGGRMLVRDTFLALSGVKQRGELLAKLASSIRDTGVAGLIAGTDPARVSRLEGDLDALAERRLRRLSVTEPLGIAVAAAFISMKVREVKNLRLMERAAAFSIPEDEVAELLVYPL
ncbi:MAG: V-type ATPase subunit [Thermodesulfobacteriota bacterium]